MATFKQKPDEGRPPDPSSTNRHMNRKVSTTSSLPTWHSNSTKRLYQSNSEFNNNTVFEVRTKFVQDLNQNINETVKKPLVVTSRSERSSLKQSLPKLLCLKKPPSVSQEDRNTFKTLNVNALRAEDFALNKSYLRVDNNESNEKIGSEDASSSQNGNYLPKNRNSFHQNVEEALSSLLWQPYEYQNSGKSLSRTSSSCTSPSSSSGDLDEITKNDGTPHHCSFTDLHLPTTPPPTSEMVVHLPDDQWAPGPRSRDPHPSWPSSWLSQVFSRTEERDARAGTTDGLDASDVQNSGDMQVNVSPGAPQGSGASPETGSRSNVTVQNVFQGSLSSANVVGLPNHTRYASVPVSTVQNRPPAIVPSHARHISEPSNQYAKYPSNNSQGNVLRHSSQLDQTTPHQINHFRSSSVPKSMPIVPRHETGSTATTTTTVPGPKIPPKFTPQMANNVSNVNVNFYRAVPVNVVSSVPTIHCLNTLSNVQGNNVSNVQVLPLGSSFPQHQVYNFPATTSVGFSNPSSSGVNGTTQVILHNTQLNNTNSIQIPSNFQNINNRSTLLSPQVVPVPAVNNRSTVSTYTSTGSFLPPPPVTSSGLEIIQNTKPSTTVVPMVNVQPSGTRTFTNAAINTMPLNVPPQPPPSKPANEPIRTPRTFTSTEAQTDEISVLPPVSEPPSGNREQRRRERRERRHQRRVNNSGHRHTAEGSTQVNDRLPDILNSHLPPPYSTLPGGMQPQSVMNSMPPPPLVPPHVMPPPPHGAVLQTVVPNNVVPPSGFVFQAPPPPPMGQVPLVQGPAPVAVPVPPPSGFRFPFPANGFRRGRFAEDPPKGCCGLLSWKPGSLRWFIALIALVAVCCVLVGTALGAMRPAGRDHLTVSLLMIGVGIVLVTVSGVAWRLTSHDSSTCRSMLGLGSTESVDVCARRFVPRLPPSYGRPHHPYAAMMYPEFQYRPPPPSYQASMQEYRLRLLLLDRGNTPQIQAGIQNAVSPPPTYRSHAGSLLRAPLSSRRDAAHSEYSCPPSYRSQNSTNRPGTIQSNSVLHSREQSLSLSESNHGGSVINVVNILGSTEEDIALDNITLDSLKMEPETELNPVKMLLKGGSSDLEGSKDGNLVTIVQTSDQSPVIVTVSGSSQIDNNSSVQITEIPSEMEILAHL